MQRYFFECSYDGGAFFGWQIQTNQISVQATIEKYLTRLNSNEKIEIVGCGRTDTGVHAHSAIFHFDIDKDIPLNEWIFKLNKMLPKSIAIKSGKKVSQEYHARFSATKRTYRYYIHREKSPFKVSYSSFHPLELDFELMNQAAKCLIGKHDFTSFSKTNTDVKTHICDVTVARWVVVNENEAYFEYTSNRFLRNMVRATVGTLFSVGVQKISVAEFQDIFKSEDRKRGSASAPAEGLFLWEVNY